MIIVIYISVHPNSFERKAATAENRERRHSEIAEQRHMNLQRRYLCWMGKAGNDVTEFAENQTYVFRNNSFLKDLCEQLFLNIVFLHCYMFEKLSLVMLVIHKLTSANRFVSILLIDASYLYYHCIKNKHILSALRSLFKV